MKGFIGSPNIDTNSRLCMASSVAGHKRAFGADVVPRCYEDLDEADLVVLVGSNAAWCHPVLFQRIQAATAGAAHARRQHRSAPHGDREGADLQLARPAPMPMLFNGLLAGSPTSGRSIGDSSTRTPRASPTLALARASRRPRRPGRATGLAATTSSGSLLVRRDASGSSPATPRASTSRCADRQGQRHHQLSPRHRPHRPAGVGPLSLTGQPNAMGGREVGGLANMLAAHMGFDPASSAIGCAGSGRRRDLAMARA